MPATAPAARKRVRQTLEQRLLLQRNTQAAETRTIVFRVACVRINFAQDRRESDKTEHKHSLALQVLLAVELAPHHLARARLARLLAFAGFSVAEGVPRGGSPV